MQKIAPDFIGLGTSYAGLGFLASWLAEHPEISNQVPAHNFFNTNNYEKHGHAWYKKRLQESDNGLKGDCTPGYLSHHKSAERIAEEYPDTKLFVVLRHPIYRALAEYQARKTFDSLAVQNDAATYLTKYTILQEQGFYGEQLNRFFEYYSPLNLQVLLYEDLINSPLEVTQDLYKYLGVNDQFVPKQLKPYAPPPEEPKHRSLPSKLINSGLLIYKKVTTRPVKPIFSPDILLRPLITDNQWERLRISYGQDLKYLSNLLNRDMRAYWRLDDDPTEI